MPCAGERPSSPSPPSSAEGPWLRASAGRWPFRTLSRPHASTSADSWLYSRVCSPLLKRITLYNFVYQTGKLVVILGEDGDNLIRCTLIVGFQPSTECIG